MDSRSAVCPVRIGREHEVAALRDNGAAKRTTFISGPAGVGKSRMSAEALALASEWGLTSLVGYCTLEQATPFEPFVAALRRRTRTMGDAELADVFAGSASLTAALLPDVARTIGAPIESPSQSDLFASIWQTLRRLAGSSGAVLLLEDLHWADADTLRLLTYLARESDDLGIWIVGTYRGDEVHRRHALAPVLADLARDRRYDEITLSSLSRDDVTAMVTAIFATSSVDDEFVEALFERTGGNPFFVEELLKVLIERGDVATEAGDWFQRDLSDMEMPLTVRETLLARVRSMSAESSALLHLAALDGDQLDPEVLGVASGMSTPDVETVIAEALNQQLLVERRDPSGSTYIFRHALTREALVDELVGPDKRQAHLRLCEGIMSVHVDELDNYAATLADHYLGGGDRERAIEWSHRTAQIAASSFAVDETGRRFEQVLGLMSPDDARRLDLLMEAIVATTDSTGGLAGRGNERLAHGFASEARRIAQARGDVVAEARALESLSLIVSHSGDTLASVELLRSALELVHGHDDVLEAWIYARLCGDLTRTDQVEEATARLPEAMALAEQSGNHRAHSRLHVIAMMNSSFGPVFSESLSAARDEAKLEGSPRSEHTLEQTGGYISLWCGAFELSRQSLLRALEVGAQLSPHDGYTAAGYVWLLSLMGRYGEMDLYLERCRQDPAVPTRIVEYTGLYEAAERRGSADTTEILETLWRVTASTGESQRSVPALSARARLTLINEGIGAAADQFWNVLDKTVSARGRGSHWLFSPDFATALLTGEHVGELTRWAAAIATVTANDAHPHNRAANAYVQGCHEIAQGEWVHARRSLDEALSLYEAMPCPARVAETYLALADLAGRLGDDARVDSAIDHAVRVASEIGADAIVARAQTAKQRAATTTILVTVLFTDIVSSTERALEIGDRAWRHLLDRHDVVVRRELDRFRGREVNTTGDGFLVAFDSPAQAIRCAQALRDALGDLGVDIRVGLHTGECQVVGNDLRGQAVHLAARVCAVGASREILLTSTVRELVAGIGFTLEDRGDVELKGFEEPWHLYCA